jgi:phosphatidylglycerophosphatase GEP4
MDDAPAAAGAAAPAAAPPPPPRQSLGQRLGQSFNAGGIAYFARIAVVGAHLQQGGAEPSSSSSDSSFRAPLTRAPPRPRRPQANRALALPHLAVADLRAVDWAALAAAGFAGAVFDKDNTLTEPYRLELAPGAAAALAAASAAFGGCVALLSNSAGLEQFDPAGAEAAALEAALGVPVLRHRFKKPAGGGEDLESHFGAPAARLVMVGDRYLTDVAYGNRLGMLTVRMAPYTSAGEPAAVRAARRVEEAFVAACRRAGVLPPPHALVEADRLAALVLEVDPAP